LLATKQASSLLSQEEFQTESISAGTNVSDGKQGCQLWHINMFCKFALTTSKIGSQDNL
jgi:hypothetical protein